MKYKVINEVMLDDKIIPAGEIVELDDKEFMKVNKRASLELVETEKKVKKVKGGI